MNGKTNVPPGYKQTEVGIIPEDWEVRKLGEIGEITGAGVDKKSRKKEKEVKLLNFLDVFNKDFLYSKKLTFKTTAPPSKIKQCSVKKGDIFFTPSSELQTDIAISAVSMEEMKDVVYSYHIVRFRLKENWDLKFRAYVFKNRRFLKNAEKMAEGSGKRYVISLKKFRNFSIPLPPTLSEQKAIAEVLSDFDLLIENLDKLIEKKKAIKQGAMQELLTGKKRLPGFTDKWVTKKLGEIGEVYSGLSGKKKSDFNEGNSFFIPFLNILTNVVVNIKELERVKISKFEKQNIVKKGDLFFNTSSETPNEVGMCAVLLDEVENTYLNSFCFGYRLKNTNVDGLFLSYLLNSNYGRKIFVNIAQGSTRYNLSKQQFLDIMAIFPSTLSEQKAIAEILSEMDAEISALEKKKQKYEALKKGAMELLLTGKIRLIKEKKEAQE